MVFKVNTGFMPPFEGIIEHFKIRAKLTYNHEWTKEDLANLKFECKKMCQIIEHLLDKDQKWSS